MEVEIIKKVFDSHGIDIVIRDGEYGYEVFDMNKDEHFFIYLDIDSVIDLSRALNLDIDTFIEEYHEAEQSTL